MRQCLESNKLKYQMMKELLENADTIENKTFFNLKRDEGKNNGGSLMNQVIEQKRNSKNAALAAKYGLKWLQYVRGRRNTREKINFYN